MTLDDMRPERLSSRPCLFTWWTVDAWGLERKEPLTCDNAACRRSLATGQRFTLQVHRSKAGRGFGVAVDAG